MKNQWKTILMWSALIVPLNQPDSWQLLKFSNLPQNQTQFQKEGMRVLVSNSSSPIIHPFGKTTNIQAVKVKGVLKGRINLKDKKQGESGADDYEFKLGLVLQGNKRLNWGQRMIAADWIKKLYSLAPGGVGIDKILFLNAVQDKKLVSSSRQHPLSDLIFEQNVWYFEKEGDFLFDYTFTKPQKALALWISIDGDDTKSSYEMLINQIELILYEDKDI
ncbi:MAG: hypothetical protein H6625_04495 [Bdellovibrionaceae bacterium]|nr:hypothetical protein [Pseudobdellovibrionaceae bacterium]